MGTSLIKAGDKAVLRAGRNYQIKCRFGARFAGLQYNRWNEQKKKFESEERQIGEEEIEIFNDTGRDATLALQWKDPADDGDVRVIALSGTAVDTDFDPVNEPAPGVMALSAEDLEAMGVPQPQSASISGGGVMTVRIFLEVEGFGSFTAGMLNTVNGISSAWVGAGVTLGLNATPAPGWQFSHWILGGIFGGTSPKHHVAARPNLKIRAVFAQAAPKALASSEAA
jgi:hypothetical protein